MKWLALAIIVVGVLGFFYVQLSLKNTKQAQVSIGNRVQYRVDIADDVIKTARGLSGREKLAEDEGMLFVFTAAAPRYFWMNEMLFPLDVLWIREGKVVGLQENIPHPAANNGKTARFQSNEPADMVLELNAGDIARQSVKVGDSFVLLP